jgi:hypothetical protein
MKQMTGFEPLVKIENPDIEGLESLKVSCQFNGKCPKRWQVANTMVSSQYDGK